MQQVRTLSVQGCTFYEQFAQALADIRVMSPCGACRRYSYSAVALNYLTSAVVMLEGIFFIGLVQQMVFGPKRCESQL